MANKIWIGLILGLIMAWPICTAYVTPSTNIGIQFGTESFQPVVWRCGAWIMADDTTETGRISNAGQELIERSQSYIFNGEQLAVDVLVLDKNGMEKVGDVYITVNGSIEANCHLNRIVTVNETLNASCNARLGEEILTKAPGANTMGYYRCVLTAEPVTSMRGNMPINVKVTDISGKNGTTAESLNYFFNPAISLSIDGNIDFGTNVRPGTEATSKTIVVRSQSEGGVRLDMFIAGKDFYDSSNSGGKCPTTNQLSLANFKYYATNGASSTKTDPRSDASGYVPIKYCIGAECQFSPDYYATREIIQDYKSSLWTDKTHYHSKNILNNGAGISMTFKLSLPVPCNGNFNDGGFYIIGEAI